MRGGGKLSMGISTMNRFVLLLVTQCWIVLSVFVSGQERDDSAPLVETGGGEGSEVGEPVAKIDPGVRQVWGSLCFRRSKDLGPAAKSRWAMVRLAVAQRYRVSAKSQGSTEDRTASAWRGAADVRLQGRHSNHSAAWSPVLGG